MHALWCAELVASTHPDFEEHLQQAAIRCQSRSRLQRFCQPKIEKPQEVNKAVADVFQTDALLAEALAAGAAIKLLSLEPAIQPEKPQAPSPEPIQIGNDKKSRAAWLAELETSADTSAPKPKINREEAINVIDSFLKNEQSIVPKRAEFFTPQKAAKQSLVDQDDIVSETLAQIYAAQGNWPKARATYEKLGLLYPEKSAYFAARFENLKALNAPKS